MRIPSHYECHILQPNGKMETWRFPTIKDVEKSIDITWGRQAEANRPKLVLLDEPQSDASILKEYSLRNKNGQTIGSVYLLAETQIFTNPQHF